MTFNESMVDMPKQSPEERRSNFQEVAYGYSKENTLQEAKRCLQCKNPQCVKGCPVDVSIPEFISLIIEEKLTEAAQKVKETNSLPAICGRVCPQETQCQQTCILGIRGEPVAIGRLERFVADFERKNGVIIPSVSNNFNKNIAVVGSGPAGLTVAADLQKLGYSMEIFESLHESGGVLMYGIPEFRLPKEIVQAEIDYVKRLGVKIHLDSTIGRLHTISELFKEGFEAIFVGSGAGLPRFMGIPGENLKGIFSANEFLIRTNLMKAYLYPIARTPITVGKNIVVVGGGNVAMDSARCALRLGADRVNIVYRRGRQELPAREEEVENAEEEGINFMLQTNPIRFLGDDRDYLTQIECIRMSLGQPDDSGRRRPIPIEGSEFLMDVDTAVIAIGQSPNPIIQQTTDGLKVTRWGTIIVDEDTMKTSITGVYAGGDVVSGAATVISAMGAGKKAARAIHEYLSN